MAKLIDIDAVVKQKVPQHYNKIPKFVLTFAKWLLCQKQLNEILSKYDGIKGVEFADNITKHLNVSFTLVGEENLPKDGGRYVFISNHPLGGFDGISYIKLLGSRYPKIKVIVNDILMNIEPLQSVFLPVNTLGAQKREDMEAIEREYHSDETQIMTFPAGFCSRYIDGKIQDIAWKKSVIRQAIDSKRDIVPMYFDGRNSIFFYSLEVLRRKLGMKFNIGLILLPWQTVRTARNKRFKVYIGKPIPWQTFDNSRTLAEWTEWLREQSYSLKGK